MKYAKAKVHKVSNSKGKGKRLDGRRKVGQKQQNKQKETLAGIIVLIL